LIVRRRSKRTDPTENDEGESSIDLISMDIPPGLPEIPTGTIKLGRVLGEGNFGEVVLADWAGTPVALKRLKDTRKYKEFFAEAVILQSINHPNVVRMLGIYRPQIGDNCMVFELAEHGNLEDFLRDDKNTLVLSDQLSMCKQIASGMRYLESINVIHRDIAARNVLVAADNRIKISDLGMSRNVREDYYGSKGTQFPIRWSAPEVLEYRKFSHKSDVWSFGVLIWEIFTNGKVPYAEFENSEVVKKVVAGMRLPKPTDCPDKIFELMQSCWQARAQDRPTFDWITEQITAAISAIPRQPEDSPPVAEGANFRIKNIENPADLKIEESNLSDPKRERYVEMEAETTIPNPQPSEDTSESSDDDQSVEETTPATIYSHL